MVVAFLFPGQGSQTVGMGGGFMDDAITKPFFEQADDALGMHLSRLMREGPDDDLRATQNAQPALLLVGYVAAFYVLKQLGKPLGEVVGLLAGHSLGEYTAVAVAGGMDLPTALRLVRARGEAMARAVPAGVGGMTAVMGLDAHTLEGIAQQNGVHVANDNGGGQVILSGPLQGLAGAEEAAKTEGAKRVIRLNVAGPFHTPAMQPAAEVVRAMLAEKPLLPLQVPVVMNMRASPEREPAAVGEGLVGQITSPVRWRESMIRMADEGITHVAELGVGKVLAGLAPRCDARLQAVALDSPRAVDEWLQQGQFA